MKFVTYETQLEKQAVGVVDGEKLIDLQSAYIIKHNQPLSFFGSMLHLLEGGVETMNIVRDIVESAPEAAIHNITNVKLLSPLPRPTSFRDFFAFEQHVKQASEAFGRTVPPTWYEIPVFYFSNHTAIYGPDDNIPRPQQCIALDYELEVACVIGKKGRNISADAAEAYIAGFMILNDWSARDLQAREMSVGLGPAKGKDFATSFGPYLVTPDELKDRNMDRTGVYNLEMSARVNGETRSQGNWQTIYFSFGQLIERASDGVTLYPGDVLGSGTVGNGCLVELTRGQGPWLEPGDVVELEIERLGILRNTITQDS